MKHKSSTLPAQPTTENLVNAAAIAGRLSVTPRYICWLADKGKIPCIRVGPRCLRFRQSDVFKALGIN